MKPIKYILTLVCLLIGTQIFAQQDIKVKAGLIHCKANTIEYYSDSTLKACELYDEQKVQDLSCIGMVEFHKDGSLRSCFLSYQQEIQTIPIMKETKLYLYPNKRPKLFILGRTVYLRDKKYKKGTQIEMDLKSAVIHSKPPK